MIENLYKVDWSKLDFPNMPNLVRALASADAEIRENAYNELYDQGLPDLPKTAVSVIPFLIELLRQDEVQQKKSLLWLLLLMASEAMAYWEQPNPDNHRFVYRVLEEISLGKNLYQQFLTKTETHEVSHQLLNCIHSFQESL